MSELSVQDHSVEKFTGNVDIPVAFVIAAFPLSIVVEGKEVSIHRVIRFGRFAVWNYNLQ